VFVAGLDVDMLLLVYRAKEGSVAVKGLCDGRTLAAAAPWVFEAGTNRPLVAVVFICKVHRKLDKDLQVLSHEMWHSLVCARASKVW
jgi:hypothetical protein